MTYEQFKSLKPSAFKRRCGVHRDTFEQMVELQCSTVESEQQQI